RGTWASLRLGLRPSKRAGTTCSACGGRRVSDARVVMAINTGRCARSCWSAASADTNRRGLSRALMRLRNATVGPDSRSYTEMEYDFAIEAGIPALAFLHKSPGEIAAGKTEPTEIGKASLTAFRKKIEARRHAEYWNSPKELAGQVALAMMSLMQIKPRVGWVRADRVPDESAAKEMLRLRERLEDAEGKLALVQSSQQKDTEHLSQGDERISLKFMFNNSRYGSG